MPWPHRVLGMGKSAKQSLIDAVLSGDDTMGHVLLANCDTAELVGTQPPVNRSDVRANCHVFVSDTVVRASFLFEGGEWTSMLRLL